MTYRKADTAVFNLAHSPDFQSLSEQIVNARKGLRRAQAHVAELEGSYNAKIKDVQDSLMRVFRSHVRKRLQQTVDISTTPAIFYNGALSFEVSIRHPRVNLRYMINDVRVSDHVVVHAKRINAFLKDALNRKENA